MRLVVIYFTLLVQAILVTPSIAARETIDSRNYRNAGYICDMDIYYEADVFKTASIACVELRNHGFSRHFRRYPKNYKPPESLGIPIQNYVQYPILSKIKQWSKFVIIPFFLSDLNTYLLYRILLRI